MVSQAPESELWHCCRFAQHLDSRRLRDVHAHVPPQRCPPRVVWNRFGTKLPSDCSAEQPVTLFRAPLLRLHCNKRIQKAPPKKEAKQALVEFPVSVSGYRREDYERRLPFTQIFGVKNAPPPLRIEIACILVLLFGNTTVSWRGTIHSANLHSRHRSPNGSLFQTKKASRQHPPTHQHPFTDVAAVPPCENGMPKRTKRPTPRGCPGREGPSCPSDKVLAIAAIAIRILERGATWQKGGSSARGARRSLRKFAEATQTSKKRPSGEHTAEGFQMA